MLIVDESTLRSAVDEAAALESAERAFRAMAEGRATLPPPMAIDIPAIDGEAHVKGAHLEGAPIFVVKVATGFYRNEARGLPNGSGLMLVFDAETGFPLALLADNGYLTELRTAAAGALAARLLAPPDVERLAIIGTGVQARFQLRAISRVCRVGRVLAWSPDAGHVERFCREMAEEVPVPVVPAASAREAVADAALVLTVTPSQAPVVESSWIAPGATVIAVGADGPDKQELPVDLLARVETIVVDRTDQCLRLGELHHAVEAGAVGPDAVHAELGEVLIGSAPGRRAGERIVCDLTGVGAQDAAIAEVAWQLCARPSV